MAGYVPDPATRESVLQIEEIEMLLHAGGKVLKDPRAAEHFMARVLATVRAYRAEFSNLHRQVQQISAEKQAQGAPTTLDPAAAVRFLPPAELARLVDGHLRTLLETVSRTSTDVEHAKRTVRTKLATVDHAVAALIADPSLDETAKAKFRALLTQMPTPAGTEPDVAVTETVSAVRAALTGTGTGPVPPTAGGLGELFD